MKLQFLGIIAVLFLLAGCANLPSQNTWNSLTGQDGRTWGYTQIQEAAQAKAIFSQPFHRKGRGRTYSRHQIKFDQIVLPPNSLNTLKLRTYCLDKSDPAPKRNEKLYLVPVGKMISSQIFPIYSSLMKYSHSHPEKHTQIQRIIWNLRSTKNPSEIRNEDYALLDTIHPGASQIVHSYFNTKKLTGMATDLIADTAGKFLNQHGLGKNLLNQQNLVSTALHSLSQSNSQVNIILRSLGSMPVSGLIPNDNSDYSLLTDGVAVKATHQGGARSSELTIRNTTDHPVVFQPAQFALESKRKTQRLGVGGVDNIKQEEGSSSKYFIAFVARGPSLKPFSATGHAFVKWIEITDGYSKESAFGYYPNTDGFTLHSLGRIRNEWLKAARVSGDVVGDVFLYVPVTYEQYRKTEILRDAWRSTAKSNKIDWTVGIVDCVTFTDQIAKTIGLDTPKDIIETMIYLATPKKKSVTPFAKLPSSYIKELLKNNTDRSIPQKQIYQLAPFQGPLME